MVGIIAKLRCTAELASAFPDQRRHLPGAVGDETGRELAGQVLIEGVDRTPHYVGTFNPLRCIRIEDQLATQGQKELVGERDTER